MPASSRPALHCSLHEAILLLVFLVFLLLLLAAALRLLLRLLFSQPPLDLRLLVLRPARAHQHEVTQEELASGDNRGGDVRRATEGR
eukprot:3935232-Rhodomonas_salina.2